MMSHPVSLKNHHHISPMVEAGPRPYVGGPIVDGAQDFFIVGGVPVAVVGGKALCTGAQKKTTIISGSSMAKINGKPIARLGDVCDYGGRIVQGISWLTFE